MQIYPAIQALYQQLYRQATLHSNFKYKSSLQDRRLTCKFIKWLRSTYTVHQITEALLIQYFEFQFSRYSGIITPKGKNNIMLNWIIGPKAINAWQNRDIKKRWLVRWHINKDFRLQLIKTFPSVVTVNLRYVIKKQTRPHEEQAKFRFYQQPKGYLYCAQMTTLYNPASAYCTGCHFKVTCQERLRLIYPELYKKRME